MIAVMPRISPRLAIFEPTEFPKAMAPLWERAAPTPTTNSGADVPYATTVRPITRGRTPSEETRPDAPRTSHSAPI